MRTQNFVGIAIAAGLLSPSLALADGLFSNGKFRIGVGGFYKSGVYKSQKSETTAFPYFAYDSDRLHVGFDGLAYKIVNQDNVEFSVHVSPGEKPDFPENNPLFAGLNRGTPVEVGFGAAYKFDVLYVQAGAMFDASSKHKGYQAQAKIGTDVEFGSLGVDFGAGIRARDGKLNNFLYGVSAAEANANRAAYSVGSTTEPFVDLTMSYALTDRIALIGIMEYRFVDKKVKNSPLTTNIDSYGVGLGLTYSF